MLTNEGTTTRGDHSAAARDANSALGLDSSFSKAWSRLGHALYSMGDYGEAAHAYSRGLDNDPGNKNMAEGLKQARLRAKEAGQAIPGEEEGEGEDDAVSAGAGPSRGAGAGGMPDLSALAGLMGGMGGGGGGGAGGMPDIASLLQNPAMMQMAQQMMGNGGLEKLMENPMLKGMVCSAGGRAVVLADEACCRRTACRAVGACPTLVSWRRTRRCAICERRRLQQCQDQC